MDRDRALTLLGALALALTADPARAHALPEARATLVGISVQIDGRPASLYPAPDGSPRHYLEARAGSRYTVSLANRTGERLGVVLTVDGLNAISGERDERRGRMYVLDPWQTTSVQGWRTSLADVRQFTFVDERRSYAARSGKANEKMGWIELAVYRERRAFVDSRPRPYEGAKRHDSRERQEGDARGQAPGAAPAARDESAAAHDTLQSPHTPDRDSGARSYPGTGWGRRAHDPVVLVSFDPESQPSECVTLRYEYRSALVALGVLPAPGHTRDRLSQRERAEPGFAQPPRF